jgi:trk system potassium uptake protein TrkH
MLGYTLYIIAAFIFLSCPFCRKVPSVSVLDTLFTAIAVISTAGLQAVNTAETFNFWGQCVILTGMQIGGLGYMTLGSWAILASKGRLSHSRIKIGKAVFAMPESFDPNQFFRHIAAFTISLELIGALVLWHAFAAAGVQNPLWCGIFHAVAAFCTAGMSLFPNGLESFAGNIEVNAVICTLALFGATGFIVLDDFYRSVKFRSVKATLTTRIILSCTGSAVVIGTVLLFFDRFFAQLPLKERTLAAFFHTVSALTTLGYSTVPMSELAGATMVVLIILMILGASPSGTGGGLKSTTWSAAIATITSFVRGKDEVTFFGSKVPHGRLTAAFAAIALYLITFSLGTYCMLLWENHLPFEDVAFEAASALGTVGLSRGITGDLSAGGKTVVMIMMYVGRLGVISLALGAVALYGHTGHTDIKTPENVKNDDIIL